LNLIGKFVVGMKVDVQSHLDKWLGKCSLMAIYYLQCQIYDYNKFCMYSLSSGTSYLYYDFWGVYFCISWKCKNKKTSNCLSTHWNTTSCWLSYLADSVVFWEFNKCLRHLESTQPFRMLLHTCDKHFANCN